MGFADHLVADPVEARSGTRGYATKDLRDFIGGDRVKGLAEVDEGRAAPVTREVGEVVKRRRKEFYPKGLAFV